MAKVAYAIIIRLKQAKSWLETIKTTVRSELLLFIEVGVKFYRAFGMWALINHNEALIKKEDYSEKNFTRLSKEAYCMADQALALCDEIKKYNHDDANIAYCQTYVEYFKPTCVNSYQLYKNIHQDLIKDERLDGDKCLSELGEEDYLETCYAKKKPTS